MDKLKTKPSSGTIFILPISPHFPRTYFSEAKLGLAYTSGETEQGHRLIDSQPTKMVCGRSQNEKLEKQSIEDAMEKYLYKIGPSSYHAYFL